MSIPMDARGLIYQRCVRTIECVRGSLSNICDLSKVYLTGRSAVFHAQYNPCVRTKSGERRTGDSSRQMNEVRERMCLCKINRIKPCMHVIHREFLCKTDKAILTINMPRPIFPWSDTKKLILIFNSLQTDIYECTFKTDLL